jgi:hypothetical protein
VRHYRGRIRAWEVLNEPPCFWWHPTPPGERMRLTNADLKRASVRDFVAFQAATARTIRAEDPDAIVVSGAGFPDAALLRRMYACGAKGTFDVASVHYLSCRHPEIYAAQVRNLRAAMEANGDGDLPIWDTESGPNGAVIGFGIDTPSEYEQLFNVYRHCFMHEQGVERSFWFPSHFSEPGASLSRRPDGGLTDAFRGMRELTERVGNGHLLRSAHFGNEAHAYVFQGPQGPMSIVWCTAPADATLPGGAPNACTHLGAPSPQPERFALGSRPLFIPGDVLAKGFTATTTGRRQAVVSCMADKQVPAATPVLTLPRQAAAPATAAAWDAIPLAATREQIAVPPQTDNWLMLASSVPAELALAWDDEALWLRATTFDDRLDPARPTGVINFALRDQDPAIAEWHYFTNSYAGMALVMPKDGAPFAWRCEHVLGEAAYPTGRIPAIQLEVTAAPGRLHWRARIPWSAVGPLRPGRLEPLIGLFWFTRMDAALDLPEGQPVDDIPQNLLENMIVHPPSLIRQLRTK